MVFYNELRIKRQLSLEEEMDCGISDQALDAFPVRSCLRNNSSSYGSD